VPVLTREVASRDPRGALRLKAGDRAFAERTSTSLKRPFWLHFGHAMQPPPG
jgi:hypothetical protein